MNLNKTGQTDLQTGKCFLVQLSLITGGKNKILLKRKLKFTSLINYSHGEEKKNSPKVNIFKTICKNFKAAHITVESAHPLNKNIMVIHRKCFWNGSNLRPSA